MTSSGSHKEEEYFPLKLFRMVDNEDYNGIIWWNEVSFYVGINLDLLNIFFSVIVDLDDTASSQSMCLPTRPLL